MHSSSTSSRVSPRVLTITFAGALCLSSAACTALTIDPVVLGAAADGGDASNTLPTSDGGAPQADAKARDVADGSPLPAARAECGSSGLGDAGGEIVGCAFGADIAIAAATHDALIVVGRSTSTYSVVRYRISDGSRELLTEWPRSLVTDADTLPLDAPGFVPSNGTHVLYPVGSKWFTEPIEGGAKTEVDERGMFGRTRAGSTNYRIQVYDPGSGEVMKIDAENPPATSLWSGPHNWDSSEYIVGISAGSLILSLPAQVTVEGVTSPGRALARLSTSGGTPVTFFETDRRNTKPYRDMFAGSAIDSDGKLYFPVDQGIIAVAAPGGAPRPFALMDEDDPWGVPEDLRLANGFLYWVDRTNSSVGSSGDRYFIRRQSLTSRRTEAGRFFGRRTTAPVFVGTTLFTTARRGGGAVPEEGFIVRTVE